MPFTLYNAPQSTCSQRVRFVLNAKKLPFEEVKLDLLAGDQLEPDYLALNPNGVVPTLVHDGAVVIDSSVIIEYLDEVAPQPESFTPRDPAGRAAMRATGRIPRREALWLRRDLVEVFDDDRGVDHHRAVVHQRRHDAVGVEREIVWLELVAGQEVEL